MSNAYTNEHIYQVITKLKGDCKASHIYLESLGYVIGRVSGSREYYVKNPVTGRRIDFNTARRIQFNSRHSYNNRPKVYNFDFVNFLAVRRGSLYTRTIVVDPIHEKYSKAKTAILDKKWRVGYIDRQIKETQAKIADLQATLAKLQQNYNESCVDLATTRILAKVGEDI